MRVGQDDFHFFARISLARDGAEAVFQNGLRVQRGHDDTDTREIFRFERHGGILAAKPGKFKFVVAAAKTLAEAGPSV